VINFVCVFRYISILGHHKQNLVVSGIVEDDGKKISLLAFLFDPFFSLEVSFFSIVRLPGVALPMWHLCHHNKILLQPSRVTYTGDNFPGLVTFPYFRVNLKPCIACNPLLRFLSIFFGALCHDDVKCWSPSRTGSYYKTVCPEPPDIRCVCYNCLICAKIYHKKDSIPKPFIACKGIYSFWLLPLPFDKRNESVIISGNPPLDQGSGSVKTGSCKTCREVAITHALRNDNSLWVENVAANEISIINLVISNTYWKVEQISPAVHWFRDRTLFLSSHEQGKIPTLP